VTQPNSDPPSSSEGLRERKKRATRRHIAEVGFQLFLENGYDATTLDTIAQAAGISRRTFFAYFKSKEDIILALQAAAWDGMLAELLTISGDAAPLDAVYKTMAHHISPYDSDTVRAMDRVMRASETLMARKQVVYAQQEESLYKTLCQVWPQPQRRSGLRIIAMLSMGALRLALEAWGKQMGRRSAESFLTETFADLKAVLVDDNH
jgi:AcrR family transcriptional regulator